MWYEVPHDRTTLEYQYNGDFSCFADLTENYMYIAMKFRMGVHVFCLEVGVFICSCFQLVSCNNEERIGPIFKVKGQVH